jgi:hypothetical protein
MHTVLQMQRRIRLLESFSEVVDDGLSSDAPTTTLLGPPAPPGLLSVELGRQAAAVLAMVGADAAAVAKLFAHGR